MDSAFLGVVGVTVAFAVCVAFLIAVLKLNNAVQNNRARTWRDAGEAFGLRFEDHPPDEGGAAVGKRLTGAFSGCALKVQITKSECGSPGVKAGEETRRACIYECQRLFCKTSDGKRALKERGWRRSKRLTTPQR